MSTEEKNTKDQASGDKSPSQEAIDITDIEEVIDLSEAILMDADDALAPESPDLEPSSAEKEEDVIELTDVHVEPGKEMAAGDTVTMTEQKDSEEEQIIELTHVVDEQDSKAEEWETLELSEAGLVDEASDEDSLLEDLDLETSEEYAEIGMEQEAARDAVAMSEEIKEEAPAQPAEEVLESALLEKLSDDRIETIIRRVVAETIERKADHILLEVAEAAIAKEIERLKGSPLISG
ncbi:MAG: hypothetical protein HWN68_06650 [Desulfobacterales bacterium]|nr:hypothetical protein [Desulfobacterales bacterium]